MASDDLDAEPASEIHTLDAGPELDWPEHGADDEPEDETEASLATLDWSEDDERPEDE